MVTIDFRFRNDFPATVWPYHFDALHLSQSTEAEMRRGGVLRPIRLAGHELPDLVRAKVSLQHRIVARRAAVNVVPPKLSVVVLGGLAADVAVHYVNVQIAIVVEIAGRDAP